MFAIYPAVFRHIIQQYDGIVESLNDDDDDDEDDDDEDDDDDDYVFYIPFNISMIRVYTSSSF